MVKKSGENKKNNIKKIQKSLKNQCFLTVSKMIVCIKYEDLQGENITIYSRYEHMINMYKKLKKELV